MIYDSFQQPPQLEKEYLSSQQWGSVLTDDRTAVGTDYVEQDGFKPMNTLWGYIIRKYADLAVPQLDYLIGSNVFVITHQ